MIPHVPEVARLSLEFLTHDPNYAEDSGDESDQDKMEEGPDDDEFDEDFDDEFSNDDDDSWKVRRTCAKTLCSLVNIYPEKLQFFYDMISLKLISRFNEREEAVRVEVLQAFTALLHQTFSQDMHLVKGLSSNEIEYEAIREVDGISNKRRKVQTPAGSPPPSAVATQQGILDQLPRIVSKISTQLSGKSAATKQACLALLTELTRTLPGALGSYLPKLAPGIQVVLEADAGPGASLIVSSAPKLEALIFLRELLRTHQPGTFHDQLTWLCPTILEYLPSNVSKLSEESFQVCRELIKSMQPVLLSDPSLYEEVPEAADHLRLIHSKLTECMELEQSVRERGTRTAAVLLFHTGNLLPEELGRTVSSLLTCVNSELVGLTSIQAFTTIFNSPALTWTGDGAGVGLLPQAAELFQALIPNLRKGSRPLRISSLECMVTIQRCLASHSVAMDSLVAQLEVMLLEFDLQELSLALTLLINVLAPANSTEVRVEALGLLDQPGLFTKLIRLPLSSHLQGVACEQYNQLLLAMLNVAAIGQDSKLAGRCVDGFLSHVIGGKLEYSSSKLAFSNLAHSLSVVIQASSIPQFVPIFTSAAQNSQAAVNERYLSFLVLGRLSLSNDISSYVDLFSCSLACFEDSNAELRLVAASAMGNFVTSNLTTLFPQLIQRIRNHDQHRYLFLHAFKEVITQYVAQELQDDSMEQFVGEFWDLLILDQAAQKSEESTRNIVAECLGILTMAYPARFLPKLHSQIQNESKEVRCVVITAIRSTFHISKGQSGLTSLLKPYMTDFLSLLKDPELEVRRLTLMTLNAAAHQRPALIQHALISILPLLFAETEIKPELIHIVIMGPFKHKVDEGLENRKAAYECIYTLLDTCLTYLNINTICSSLLLAGLQDSHEIKLLTHMLIVRLAKLTPAYLRRNLEPLVQPMADDLAVEIKENALRQEAEKHTELVRSTLRAMVAMETISEGYPHPQFDRLRYTILEGAFKDDYKNLMASYKVV
ncbi:hypothetical protein DSO57_1035356 [Entomophthora muscae]|uniref:Uncharacterized protein n=1 Tax=Entomophthora muscae TaxID=34485 RepID=A0ACC2SCE7_9FUNG|nr:hypothetical protein DSO57_1035356 [Entomophthora muscae]